MEINSKQKKITAILPKGQSVGVIIGLKEEKGIITANVNTARGMGKLTPNAYRGVGEQTEKEILDVVIESERADEIFEFIYETAEINRPHGGIIYMSALQQASAYSLPEIPEEE